MYNLNDSLYDPIVFKEDILNAGITEYDILRYYCPRLKFDTANQSPFREDSVPSFGVTMRTGFLYWRDFATGESGNIWSLVAKLFSTDFAGALQIIARDFGLKDGANFRDVISEIDRKYPITEKKQVEIGIRTRNWKSIDKEFWTQFGISKSTLETYLVSPIDFMFFNGHPVKAERYSYVYRELKDGILTFKIYQPFSDRKWISNNNQSVWEGWSQLPETGDKLIITSSRKDLMSIWDTTGIPSVSLQAESMMPKAHVVNQLVDRFSKVYVFYDNDFDNPKNPGRVLGNKIATEFGLDQIEIPDQYRSKDYSDLVKNHGRYNASDIINNLLK